MGIKIQRAVYVKVNISDDQVYDFSKVFEWGRLRNTGSHTRTTITPVTRSYPESVYIYTFFFLQNAAY